MSTTNPPAAFAYDAVSLLGFGAPNAEPLPEPAPGEVLLRYGGWSFRDLHDVMVPRELMRDQNWYEQDSWSAEKLPSGLFVLRLPVPDSNHKTFEEQKTLLLPGEEVVPVLLAASALLSIRLAGGEEPLKGNWTRCREQTDPGVRVGLYWYDGRLGVLVNWGGHRLGCVWLASARRLPS